MNASEKEFLDLINQYQKVIHKVCHMYTNNSDDHEDLFQEILLQLWKGYPRFKGNAKITTWMYRVALYTAMTRNKKQQKIQASTSDIPEQAQAEDHYRYENLEMAIASLPDNDKALIMLYLEEKPYKEIADIVGLTENNVGVKLNRIKKKLKDILVSR